MLFLIQVVRPELIPQSATTSSPRFSENSTGFQCAREMCSRLWCWCGSVLTALLPAIFPNSAFLLTLLQVVSISGHPRQAYYKFPEPKPQLAGGASLSRDHLCGTVFLLLYRDQRWLCTLSSDNWRPSCSTSDVLANRRNIHHRPALLWRFRDSGAGYKTADLLTYLLVTIIGLKWPFCHILQKISVVVAMCAVGILISMIVVVVYIYDDDT